MHGYGVRKWNIGPNKGDSYEGNWFEGKYSGILTQLIVDQRSGQGTYNYENGNKYIGNWEKNVKHGMNLWFNKDIQDKECFQILQEGSMMGHG